jgi:tRNA uridine 5-carboxymethylaminomethyl modification enzyme
LPSRLDSLHHAAITQIEIALKYEGYIARELGRIEKSEHTEREIIPKDIAYDDIVALRAESREKLKKVRPESLGQASRISGVNPSDIAILSVWMKKMREDRMHSS